MRYRKVKLPIASHLRRVIGSAVRRDSLEVTVAAVLIFFGLFGRCKSWFMIFCMDLCLSAVRRIVVWLRLLNNQIRMVLPHDAVLNIFLFSISFMSGPTMVVQILLEEV